MVRTTWRCGTGARTSFWSHSAHRSWRFFSQDGIWRSPPTERVRQGRGRGGPAQEGLGSHSYRRCQTAVGIPWHALLRPRWLGRHAFGTAIPETGQRPQQAARRATVSPRTARETTAASRTRTRLEDNDGACACRDRVFAPDRTVDALESDGLGRSECNAYGHAGGRTRAHHHSGTNTYDEAGGYTFPRHRSRRGVQS
jgi:hypothetical protein